MTKKKAYQRILGGFAAFLILTIILLLSPKMPDSDQFLAKGAAGMVVLSGGYNLFFLHRIFTDKKYRSLWDKTLLDKWVAAASLLFTGLAIGVLGVRFFRILGGILFFTGIFMPIIISELTQWIAKLPNDR